MQVGRGVERGVGDERVAEGDGQWGIVGGWDAALRRTAPEHMVKP